MEREGIQFDGEYYIIREDLYDAGNEMQWEEGYDACKKDIVDYLEEEIKNYNGTSIEDMACNSAISKILEYIHERYGD